MISEKVKLYLAFALILITFHIAAFLVTHFYVVPTFKASIYLPVY